MTYIHPFTKCMQTKPVHHKPYRMLKFLLILQCPWNSISMDFIEGLLPSDEFDCILVIVDRLMEYALFIECHSTDSTLQLAMLYLKHIFTKHSVLLNIISNHSRLFISEFWTLLCKLLDIKANLLTAYHPKTNRQTECINQILEQYLHLYINYQQDNWVSLLLFAEFVYNNTLHSTTQVTPFFANKGYHLRFEIRIDAASSLAT